MVIKVVTGVPLLSFEVYSNIVSPRMPTMLHLRTWKVPSGFTEWYGRLVVYAVSWDTACFYFTVGNGLVTLAGMLQRVSVSLSGSATILRRLYSTPLAKFSTANFTIFLMEELANSHCYPSGSSEL